MRGFRSHQSFESPSLRISLHRLICLSLCECGSRTRHYGGNVAHFGTYIVSNEQNGPAPSRRERACQLLSLCGGPERSSTHFRQRPEHAPLGMGSIRLPPRLAGLEVYGAMISAQLVMADVLDSGHTCGNVARPILAVKKHSQWREFTAEVIQGSGVMACSASCLPRNTPP